MWSPGNVYRLLGVYDEDGMVEKWILNGSGAASVVSDATLKEYASVIAQEMEAAVPKAATTNETGLEFVNYAD